MRPFRFGVVAAPQGAERWVADVKRIADLGYSTVLMPDGVQLLSPFSSLAVAATVAPVRVGTFVLASPLRTPRQAAWEAHSLSVLTQGRFDMGIGTGHDRVPQGAAELGMPYGTAVRAARPGEADRRPPPRARRRAAHAGAHGGGRAQGVDAGRGDRRHRDDRRGRARGPRRVRRPWSRSLRAAAGARAEEIELAMNLFVVGDEVPPWTKSFIGADMADLVAADSLTLLRGDVDAMVDELQRRREAFGTSYVSVNGAFYEALAPVVERLAGQ